MLGPIEPASVLERRSLLWNHGVTPLWRSEVGSGRDSKFFTRGARGHIRNIEVYCRDAGAAGGNILVGISPFPGMGPLTSAYLIIPAGGGPAWRAASFVQMWNYDSLFITLLSSAAAMEFAYDAGRPLDSHTSANAGAIRARYA